MDVFAEVKNGCRVYRLLTMRSSANIEQRRSCDSTSSWQVSGIFSTISHFYVARPLIAGLCTSPTSTMTDSPQCDSAIESFWHNADSAEMFRFYLIVFEWHRTSLVFMSTVGTYPHVSFALSCTGELISLGLATPWRERRVHKDNIYLHYAIQLSRH